MKNVYEKEITIEGAEWEELLNASFNKKQKNITVDGFRPGSVPKDVYLKKFGIESLFSEAVDAAISIAYKKVLNESSLIPEVEPKVDIVKIDEKGVTFKFTIITKPEVKLGKYKDLKVKKETATATVEEINTEIEALRLKYAETVFKDNGEIVSGNTAVIDFEGLVEGKPLEGGSGKDYPLEIGSHTFIPGFEEGLIGAKKGEQKELSLVFPENYTENLKNKPVLFKVTVKEIKERVLPELNEEFYKDLGYEDVKTEEELKREVEKTIIAKKEASIEDKYIEDCLAKAVEGAKIEINEEIVDEEIHRMIHQFEEQLKMQGLNIEQYFEFTGGSHEKLHETMHEEATRRVKYRYLIEEVATSENIEATDTEAEEEATKSAEKYGTTKEEFLSMIGGLDMMKYDIKMRKAVEIIKG